MGCFFLVVLSVSAFAEDNWKIVHRDNVENTYLIETRGVTQIGNYIQGGVSVEYKSPKVIKAKPGEEIVRETYTLRIDCQGNRVAPEMYMAYGKNRLVDHWRVDFKEDSMKGVLPGSFIEPLMEPLCTAKKSPVGQ